MFKIIQIKDMSPIQKQFYVTKMFIYNGLRGFCCDTGSKNGLKILYLHRVIKHYLFELFIILNKIVKNIFDLKF